jgi:DNA integrity scanning protein DisA with diadenylate cyclase activity
MLFQTLQTLQIKDIIDVALVAFLVYQCYVWTRGTGARNIFLGLIVCVAIWYLVTKIFELRVLGTIFKAISGVGVFALIVIFQVEIRRFFSKIGSRLNWKHFLS